MALFDWQAFLDRHGIDHVVQRKDIYIHCVFCGAADHGKKMGISTIGRGWGCWRQQSHRGKDPTRLIQALLGCSWVEAQRLAGGTGGQLPGLGGFMAAVQGALGASPPAELAGPLAKPREFRPLRPGGQASIFYEYLADRGFTAREITNMAHRYDLHYSLAGDWSYRLIIPVQDEFGEWFTWTGRTTSVTAKVRYKTLTANPDNVERGDPLARGPITDCLLGLPKLLLGGEVLVIAEGPFDAMRLSLFTHEIGARATCLFGKAVSASQIDLIMRLRLLYKSVVLLLDPDAALDAMALQTRLAPLNVVSHLLEGDDDPGEMKASKIRALLYRLQRPLRKHNHVRLLDGER